MSNDDDVKDYKPMSSISGFNNFIGSLLHKDYLKEVDIRIEGSRDSLEQNEDALNGVTHKELRGRIKTLREMKDIFEQLRDNKEDDERRIRENDIGR